MGYLVCKQQGINIFEVGSKNPGSTNVGRVLGKNFGRAVFILDLAKTCLPIFICLFIMGLTMGISMFKLPTYYRNMTIFYTGVGAVIGHNFPFTTHFKGGKGITCTVAVIFYFDILYAVFLYLFHRIVQQRTHYVSLASIVTLIALFASACVFTFFHWMPFTFENAYQVLPAIGFMMVFGILRHSSNIKRLIDGTENKI